MFRSTQFNLILLFLVKHICYRSTLYMKCLVYLKWEILSCMMLERWVLNFNSYDKHLKIPGLNGTWTFVLCNCAAHCSTISSYLGANQMPVQFYKVSFSSGFFHSYVSYSFHCNDRLLWHHLKIQQFQYVILHIYSYSLSTRYKSELAFAQFSNGLIVKNY